jgi:putative endonuclease
MWHVYILQCYEGSYYTGITGDLKTRLSDHNRGKGSLYTRLRRPVKLVYAEKIANKKNAEIREIEIKQLSKRNKEKLIKFGLGERVSLVADN